MTNGVSFDQMISCVIRELGMRERVYPKWVEQGKMRQQKADEEIRYMEAILQFLKDQAGRTN